MAALVRLPAALARPAALGHRAQSAVPAAPAQVGPAQAALAQRALEELVRVAVAAELVVVAEPAVAAEERVVAAPKTG